MRTSSSHHRFREHPVSATPHERRKFGMLCILAGLVVILLWIFFLPMSYRVDPSAKNLGPFGIAHTIGSVIQNGIDAYRDVRAQSNTQPTP